ncbi:Origin of replication complex subunit 6 [Bulinus truncatus]|nr:Origin of replication complex subunit 6 [Bulinus truncatus]
MFEAIINTAMSCNASILDMLSHKLGTDNKVRVKASELNELLEVRAAASLSALRLTGSCRLVISLDLASKIYGCSLNHAEVVRLSTMTKKNYIESTKVIAKLLNLEDQVTLQELALQFGCHSLMPLATDVLKRYSSQQCSDMDYYSPMFLCAALIVAARKQKIKINVGKLREKSGVKKITFDKIVADMENYSSNIADDKSPSSSKKRSLLDIVEDQFQGDQLAVKKSKSKDFNTDHSEKSISPADYEEWKKKILTNVKECI